MINSKPHAVCKVPTHCQAKVIKEMAKYNRRVCRHHQKMVWKGRGLMAQYMRVTESSKKDTLQNEIDQLAVATSHLQEKIDKSEALLTALLLQEKQSIQLVV